MTYIVCRRSSNSGNQKAKLTIPFEEMISGSPMIETDAAYGFHVNGTKVWLPKSQIEGFQFEDFVFTVWCPMWLIESKGLEIFIDTSHEPSLF